MGIVYVLLPASILLATLGVVAFVWAARQRQFDNVDVSGARLLFERDPAAGPNSAPSATVTAGPPVGEAAAPVAQGERST